MAVRTDRPVQNLVSAPAVHVAPIILALADPEQTVLALDAYAAPPGGTLLAQHTSLLC